MIGPPEGERCRREQQERGPGDARTGAEECQQQRGKESAQTPHGSHQARHRTGLLGKILRHELEDTPVAEAQQRRAAQRPHRKGYHRGPTQQQGKGDDGEEHAGEDARPAHTVREPPSQGTAERGQSHEPCGAKSGIHRAQPELCVQQTRQIDGEGHEAAESQEVEGSQNPGEPLVTQHRDHLADAPGAGRSGRVPRKQEKHTRPQDQHQRAPFEHPLPPDGCGQQGSEEDRG